MDQNNIIECGGFYFIHNFDSGNLGHVERVPTELIVPSVNSKTNATETPDYEFNLWTRPDCAGTEFENGNRTWFYFGMQATEAGVLVRLNLINLNKQGKMYNQGMAPVTRTLPGKPQWERIKDRPVHSTDDNTFTLSFKYRTPDNMKATTFFAFTYPFSFAELQIALNSIDLKMLPLTPPQSPDDIYYCRECLIYSLEGRRTDLLTISSYHGITTEREERLKNLFPENNDRPFKFTNKKVIFISARVHPGETPSSFVFNGFLNLLLNRNDPIAIALRKLYVFKLIPFLNPDGVARGHYRTDTRGVNLNRVYLNPSLIYHPTVYASRALIRYYHYGCEKEDILDESKSFTSRSIQNIGESVEIFETKKPREKKSSSSSFKGNEICKREKSGKPTLAKSSTTIKQPSTASDNSKSGEINTDQNAIVQKRLVETNAQDKPAKLSVNNKSSTKPSREANKRNVKTLSGEAAHLAEQVYDMKLQERPSQTSESSSKTNLEETPSLLNDSTLRTCLGSNVHLSTSEELNFQGNNPLRPLRDTLKNSISLLMGSNSSHAEDISPVGQDSSNVKMSWCRDCRLAVSKLENTMPGITNMVPGYNLTMSRQQSPSHQTFENINEYRMHQLQQIDEYDLQSLDNSATDTQKEKDDSIYFCTNCFKRYIINELNEEVKLNDVVSTQSMGVSAGDSGDVRTESESTERPTDSTGDSLPSPVHQPTEKPKSTTRQNKKKNNPPTPSPPVVNNANVIKVTPLKEPESGLYLYIDLHGHASKKGIFMYGNHFDELESCVECMLLPRIMSLNNLHFHFSSCNFTERNMYLKDRRDGMSREGSGRVAVFKATGLVRSYTLECNYNTGRLVNVLPPTVREGVNVNAPLPAAAPLPPKYTPHIFEEVGRSLGASILDLTGQHPNSRIPCSEHRNLAAVRDWLRSHTRTTRPQLTTTSRLRPKPSSPTRLPIYARSKGKVTEERKENTYVGVKPEPPPLAPPVAMKFSKKNEPVKSVSRTRYLSENEPKPKTLSTKRRNILAVRKPNASKTTVGGVVKPKLSRRSVDDGESPRASVTTAKMGKRGFTRVRATRTTKCPRALASSSSDDLTGGQWEDVPGGTALGNTTLGAKRRPYPAPPPPLLKKIRLKTAL